MALLDGAGVAHLVNNSVGDGVADGGGPGSADGPGGGVTHWPGDGGALGHAGADRDRHANRVGDLTGGLDGPGVAHPPGLGVAVGSRGVTSSSSNRSSGISGSIESIGISLSIGLTLANVVVDKSSSIANSLNSSSNTGNTGNRGDSNTSNTRCV